jgi:polar amino acid transport system permease protein
MELLLEQLVAIAQYYPVILKGVGVTLAVSMTSIIVGGSLGFVLGIGRSGTNGLFRWAIGAYTDVFRGTPVLVQLFVVFFILPEAGIELDSFSAGAIALSNITACFVSEIVASAIKAVPRGQLEAAASAGFTRFQQMRLIILPQATKMIIPSLVGQFVLVIKDSSVVSAIGLFDLTRAGWVIVQSIPNGFLVFSLVGIFYFVICYPLIHLSRRLERS